MTQRERRSLHQSGADRHHLLWDRKTWSKNPNTKKLRDFWYCQIYIPRELHQYIHHEIYMVPPPSQETCQEVLQQLRFLAEQDLLSEYDPLEKRLNILIHCTDSLPKATKTYLKLQLEASKNYF